MCVYFPDKLSADQLKSKLVSFLNGILAKVQEQCDNDEMRDIIAKGYAPIDASAEPEKPEVIPALNDKAKELVQKLELNGAKVS